MDLKPRRGLSPAGDSGNRGQPPWEEVMLAAHFWMRAKTRFWG